MSQFKHHPQRSMDKQPLPWVQYGTYRYVLRVLYKYRYPWHSTTVVPYGTSPRNYFSIVGNRSTPEYVDLRLYGTVTVQRTTRAVRLYVIHSRFKFRLPEPDTVHIQPHTPDSKNSSKALILDFGEAVVFLRTLRRPGMSAGLLSDHVDCRGYNTILRLSAWYTYGTGTPSRL